MPALAADSSRISGAFDLCFFDFLFFDTVRGIPLACSDLSHCSVTDSYTSPSMTVITIIVICTRSVSCRSHRLLRIDGMITLLIIRICRPFLMSFSAVSECAGGLICAAIDFVCCRSHRSAFNSFSGNSFNS